ncbi:MAG TPA: TlpA family protein disulfide reductase [Clostridiales bacterium]|jgi:thiol-disulfide isomerase/thioredoxin|nr:TlpA family protein disulfide reductase [Clostridiales bacterium]
MKNLRIITLILAILFLFSACGNTNGGSEEPTTSLANIQTTDIEGHSVDAAIFSDFDLTMVNFWSITCPPCIREMPDLAELHTAHEGFQVVGVVLNIAETNMDQLPAVLQIVEQTGAAYPHLAVSESLHEAKTKDITYVPETIFVNADGHQVGESYVGAKSYEDWNAIIEALLEDVR